MWIFQILNFGSFFDVDISDSEFLDVDILDSEFGRLLDVDISDSEFGRLLDVVISDSEFGSFLDVDIQILNFWMSECSEYWLCRVFGCFEYLLGLLNIWLLEYLAVWSIWLF